MLKDPNNLELIEDRKRVSYAFLNAVYQDQLIIFEDETGFNNNLTPIYGYSLIGKRCHATCPYKSSKR